MCTKLQGYRSARLRLIEIFASVRKHEKEEKKSEEKIETLAARILEMA